MRCRNDQHSVFFAGTRRYSTQETRTGGRRTRTRHARQLSSQRAQSGSADVRTIQNEGTCFKVKRGRPFSRTRRTNGVSWVTGEVPSTGVISAPGGHDEQAPDTSRSLPDGFVVAVHELAGVGERFRARAKRGAQGVSRCRYGRRSWFQKVSALSSAAT